MKRFILKILAFLLCFSLFSSLILFLTFSYILPQYSGTYNAATIDKLNRLNSIQEPKIILVGNSSLAFGMDSAMLEETFNMPVVNLGLHAGLGMQFQLNMAKSNIRSGDIVIITSASDSLPLDQPRLAWITIENYNLWSLIPKENQFDMLRALPKYIGESIITWLLKSGNGDSGGVYSRSAFNEYGDICYPRPECLYTFHEDSHFIPELTEAHVRAVNDFSQYCDAQGAVCLVTYFPIAYGEFSPDAQEFEPYQTALEEKLNCDVISHYSDYFFAYDNFYDTHLHLNDKGVAIRTAQLIQDLKNWGL